MSLFTSSVIIVDSSLSLEAISRPSDKSASFSFVQVTETDHRRLHFLVRVFLVRLLNYVPSSVLSGLIHKSFLSSRLDEFVVCETFHSQASFLFTVNSFCLEVSLFLGHQIYVGSIIFWKVTNGNDRQQEI